MPRPSLRASAGEPRRRRRPPISTAPSSGWTKPLAIPSNVDFPDPFSPTSAWISPARQSTLTSRSACTAPNAFDTPRRVSTRGLAGPGLDIVCFLLRFLWLIPSFLLGRVHLVEQAPRGERPPGGVLRVALG